MLKSSIINAWQGPTYVSAEAVAQRRSVKKVFLEILQNSQENTCARGVNQVAGPPLLKERLWHMCYPVSFAKFLRTPFLTEHLGGCFYLC